MIDEKRREIIISLTKIVLPFIIGLGTVYAIGYSLDPDTRVKLWSLIAAYFFPPLGKESVIPAAIAFGINPLLIALSIAFVDSVVSLFMVWNYDLVKKIPILGNFVRKVEDLGIKGSKRYAWVRPLKFIGIVLFVMVPFQGSGGVVGSILGRIIGMRAVTTWLAVTTGAVVGCLLIAFSAKLIFMTNVLFGVALIIIAVVIFVLYRVAKQNNSQVK
ncbi:MAG TPA: hypothetical protein ENG74_02505 [Thermoplasmatales archaeon]|nr:hypothetical protein [Thermoplasmatales archaeon]